MSKQNWEKRRLGRTGFAVTTLGIGSAWLGHKGGGDYCPDTAVETVLAGLASGINLIDTSDNYIAGRSETFVGRALAHWFAQGNRREDLILSTKLTVHPGNLDAFSYDGTMWAVEHSLKELGVDYLDVFLVHDPQELDPVLAENGAIAALRKLKQQGTIRAIGLGCRPHAFHQQCIETGEFDVSLTFHDYNLMVTTAAAGVLDHAVQQDVGVFNASINAAVATSQNADRSRQVSDWCREHDVDLDTLNLHFCLRERRFASILIGFSRPARVEQNVQAYAATIDQGLWDELERDLGLSTS
ncbi:MAG: aldo/keto reductase [Gemmatimonadetes bacterium]|nr:aldo/keto reductase [Gemmatimonadota bacterium]